MTDQFPPEREESANRNWRIWASVGVVSIVVLAAILGFVVLPGEGGVSEAMGDMHHEDDEWQATIADAVPATEVAWTVETIRALADADANAGATLAEQRCASCHGQNGISENPAFPSIAGQPAAATYKQLRDFADGYRLSPVMAGMAMSLDDQQMMHIAAFYASQVLPVDRAGPHEGTEARELAVKGDPARGLPSCNSCHANGAPRGTPAIDGLPVAYLTAQLQAFAAGDRANDIYGLMRMVAEMLTEEEVAQLAAYYGR